MRAGRLRHRIRLLEPSTTRNAMNQRTGEPTLFAERRARVRVADGAEQLAAAQTGARLSHVVEMRYLAGVRSTMIVDFDDRLLDVNAVIPDEKKRDLVLHCTERPS